MAGQVNTFGQTAHKPDCPVLLYAGANCTCGLGDWRAKGPVATQLARIEESQGKLHAAQNVLCEMVTELVKRQDENYNLTKIRAEMNYERLSGQVRGTADAIATALGEQRAKLETIDTLATGLHIRWEAKFSKSKGRKPHGKHSKVRANRKTRRRTS